MSPRVAAVLLAGAVFYACDGSPTAAAPLRLTAAITPNPMRSPSGPGSSLLWTLELKASGSGSILLQRGYARLVDSAGRIVGSNVELWSRAAGCESCKTDVRIDDGSVTVEVPVHRFAQASGSSGDLELRSALTMNRWGAGPM
jgi:hypothetical protein